VIKIHRQDKAMPGEELRMFMIMHMPDEHGEAKVISVHKEEPTVVDFMDATDHPDFRRKSAIHVVKPTIIESHPREN